MGLDSQDILETTGITAEERADYNSVATKFDKYFGVRKNVIFEKAQFNSKRQQPGETREQYILALSAQAVKWGYTSQQQKEQDIHDSLVIGIRDTQLSKKMQLDAELTLDKAKKRVLQTEAVQETNKKLATPSVGDSCDNPLKVDAVTWRNKRSAVVNDLLNGNIHSPGTNTGNSSRRADV